jgi:RNA polymerase-binding protein DksA
VQPNRYSEFHQQLSDKKRDLSARLERINSNLRRGVDADSKERAKQLEDQEVVDALGNEAREEIEKITAALERLAAGTFGACIKCGAEIRDERLAAYPHAEYCMECATTNP